MTPPASHGASSADWRRCRPFWALAVALVGLLIAGCGAKPKEPISVKGTVVGYNHQSVEGAVVTFWPTGARNAAVPAAVCAADGRFNLQCVEGTYKATVTPKGPLGMATVPAGQQPGAAVPAKYQDATSTTLTVTIPKDAEEILVLQLE